MPIARGAIFYGRFFITTTGATITVEFNIVVPPDIETLIMSKGKEIMSPEGVPETIVMASQTIVTLTQGGKYRVYLLGRCNHVHNMGIMQTEAKAVAHMGNVLATEAAMILEPAMTREIMLAALRKRGDDK